MVRVWKAYFDHGNYRECFGRVLGAFSSHLFSHSFGLVKENLLIVVERTEAKLRLALPIDA